MYPCSSKGPEAKDWRALARGMPGVSIRVSRAVNRQLSQGSAVLRTVPRARVETPRSVRIALRYVLLNARKHGSAVTAGFVDSYSSAPWFRGFSRPEELAFGAREARSEWSLDSGSSEPPVVGARSWRLRSGQQRAGARVRISASRQGQHEGSRAAPGASARLRGSAPSFDPFRWTSRPGL